MATIREIILSIQQDVANARIGVEYTIEWSNFDQTSNLQYAEAVRLIGDDTVPPTGILNLREDEVDDAIVGGGLSAPGGANVIQSDGQPSVQRRFTKVIPLANLNEDRSQLQNPDEIRAEVTLTPILPTAVRVESNLVTLTLN
jgi:hypothetical protein